MKNRLAVVSVLALLVGILPAATTSAQVSGTDVTYTTDADFDLGTLVSVNHDAPFSNQLQLDSPTEPFPFINVAASGRGTVVRVNTDTGEIVGEYRTAPEGRGLDPSRTTVDLFGNVWTANRGEIGEIDGLPHGSAVKIGLIVGGARVNGDGTPNPAGEYLAPPFGYNTCSDRDGDGFIRTSAGLDTVLDWPAGTDGLGGTDGLVQDAVDECVLIYQRLPDAEQARHVSVDADNNVWVGGFPFEGRMFYKLSGNDGAVLDSFDARDIGCGGYGGLVDGNGVLWSIGWGTGNGALLRYDPSTGTGSCINIYGGYGLGIDTNGYVWGSIWENGIAKVSPDGVLEPGFPKSTYPTPSSPAPPFSPLLVEAKPVLTGMILAAQAAPDPWFYVEPDGDWIGAWDGTWPADAAITFTIDNDSDVGNGVLYSGTATANSAGRLNIYLDGVFDIQRGNVVTVSDGITPKIHTVTNLYVGGFDVDSDTVYGTTDPLGLVEVIVHGVASMEVTADDSGNWTADFASIDVDINSGSDGVAHQYDDDNDGTRVGWTVPWFYVNPEQDWIGAWDWTWPSDAAITFTVDSDSDPGNGVLHSGTATATPKGRLNIELSGVFDIEPGHIVTVWDDTTTKSHAVTNLDVAGVDLDRDTVFGTAEALSELEVHVHGAASLVVSADGLGNWTADFGSIGVDINYGSDGVAHQYDTDDDGTRIGWAPPKFQVSPDDNWVQSSGNWTPGATISLTIEDGGSGVVYSDTQTADGQGYFNFEFGGAFDLQRGHVVTVFDGTTTKTHTVMNLYVDGVDVTADTVFGRADAGTSVDIWVHGDGNVTATADGSGNWTADFSAMTDLTYLSDGGSQQWDIDGDSTGVWWASPRFQVSPDDDWVQSYNRWSPGATISLTISGGGGYSDSQTADTNGNFNFNLGGIFDLQRGHVVTVSDGTTTKTHTVMNLYVDGVDVTADTVFGRADAGTSVDIWVHGDGNVTATADGSGNWTADFSAMTDLTYLSDGGSQQFDDDGDSTGVWWASPRFQVSPDDDWVQSYNRWSPGATISLTISGGGGYSDTLTADTNGNFNFNLGGIFNLQPGHVVTVSDGTTTKTHTVIDVMAIVHTAADTVMGTANPGAWVEVGASQFQDWSGRLVQADSGGNWTADFSVPADGQPAYDITGATFVDVEEFDDDGDATYRRFGPPVQANRGVAVTPIDNHVWVASSGIDAVTRLDNDGNVLKIIDTGDEPTGVAVDAAGKVWVTNQFSDNTVRIDPSGGSDGLGAVDLTVYLGEGANPYNYSDMTGAVVVGSTSPQGFWTVIQDSGEANFEWGRLTWNTEPEGNEPAGTAIVVEVRTSDSEAGLGGQTFMQVANGELFFSYGQYIEVRATLKASPGGLSPILSDIRVQPAIIEVPVDIKPTSCPNPFNVDKRGVMPVAILGTGDFDVTDVDPASVMLEGVAPLRWAYEDVATPFEPYLGKADAYDCNEYGSDGYMDLTVKFEALEVAAALGDVADGEVLALTLTGELLDGTPTVGEDVIVILKKGKK